ncbi:heat-inducible transcription repressor HrcA [Gleimia coleocanis DSM 15436]|uniref:Heat-inducible transcription repressor HrcA n=1 Tax=Gleimia coleocanis DSM 15436 TaxID=525245 RepID=C0W098_9ACTO|nr:heat-inducible transcriptional repressor HrcA [Gleimia coleocanis]EEH63957.1 heat-inducible transcription repressor HrcA [Gleimia coleocanis DSM 15436]
MSTADRRLDVLRAIVSDYVSTREPVGSKTLVERYDLGVSPATIRNDMAVLEEEGLIYQPHTSAGRVPTPAGYRLFVDRLAQVKPLSAPERAAIEQFLENAVSVDEIVERTVRLMAQLTRQVAVVQYPQYAQTKLVCVELVDLGERRLMVVAITDDGNVERRTLSGYEISTENLNQLKLTLSKLCVGKTPLEIETILQATLVEWQNPAEQVIGKTLLELTKGETEHRMVIAGTANLARAEIDFQRSIVPVLDALEEQVSLLRLFSGVTPNQVSVSIGAENHHDGLIETSIVAGKYGTQTTSAHLAVVGPVRMDYGAAMSTVQSLSAYLSHYLQK